MLGRLIPAAAAEECHVSFVLKEWFDPGAHHRFHPPLPPCGPDGAPHRASWMHDRQGVHGHQRFSELRSVRK